MMNRKGQIAGRREDMRVPVTENHRDGWYAGRWPGAGERAGGLSFP